MSKLQIHPLVIWTITWGTAILLNNRYYSDLLFPFSMNFYIVVYSIFGISLYIVMIQTVARNVFSKPGQPSVSKEDYDVSTLSNYISSIFIILLFGYSLEIMIEGWVPIIWYLLGMAGEDRTYHEYGIKGLHGLFQSLYFFATSGLFLCYLKTGNRRLLVRYFLALLIPILFITRQAIIIVLLQSAILYFLNRKVKLRNIFISIGIMIVNILLFGLIGAFRTGTEAFMSLAEFSDKWPSWLPSGFAWVYIYITTPLSNLDYTFETFKPDYRLYYLLIDLLPSPIRVLIYPESVMVKGDLASTFNVSSYLVEAFQDFGLIGPIIFGILAFAIVYYFYLKAIRVRTIDYQLMYAILGQCMILSIFYNHFTFLPVITQVIWVWIYRLYANKRAIKHLSILSQRSFTFVLGDR